MKKKKRPILKLAIVFSIIVELVLMLLVYYRIGAARLPIHISRLIFQFVLIFLILKSKSNTALFILTAYHISTGIIHLLSYKSTGLIGNSIMLFHLIIGILIYFHDYFEDKLIK